MHRLFARHVLLGQRWASDVLITVADDGMIERIEPDTEPASAVRLPGPVLPGMVNLHSHAFQCLMAGLAETAASPTDSFWSWRERMYALVARLTPAQMEAVCRYLYIRMLKAGYTTVAEFHYLHHRADGAPYPDRAEMARRVMAAAAAADIGLCLLPVFYAHGGFGPQPPAPGQLPFINDIDGYLELWRQANDSADGRPDTTMGLAFHSLRAVTAEEIETVRGAVDGQFPIHIHIAEQIGEVTDCLAWSGQRPVAWLLDHVPVDSHWCLVHATHADTEELAAIRARDAVVGLCPTTEANLGDGIFPASEFIPQGGRFGIGSDSQVSVSVVEELRWLEYGQRLTTRQRNRLALPGTPEVGTALYAAAACGGARAVGQPVGRIEVGRRADLVVLDGDHPLLAGCAAEDIPGRWLFGGDDAMVREVFVAGRPVVADGAHADEAAAGWAFAEVARELLTA